MAPRSSPTSTRSTPARGRTGRLRRETSCTWFPGASVRKGFCVSGSWRGSLLPRRLRPRRERVEQHADEALALEIDLRDDLIGAARQPEPGAEIVFETACQLSLQDREDVVLLAVERIVVVDQPDRAVKFQPRSQAPHRAIIDSGRIAEFKTL